MHEYVCMCVCVHMDKGNIVENMRNEKHILQNLKPVWLYCEDMIPTHTNEFHSAGWIFFFPTLDCARML